MGVGSDTSGESLRRRALIVEAQAIERAAWVWSVLYRREYRFWRRLDIILLTSATVLAAVAGGAGFSQLVDRRIAAIFALAAAVLAGVSTALSAATRASTAEVAAKADLGLADAARVFRLFDPIRGSSAAREWWAETAEAEHGEGDERLG